MIFPIVNTMQGSFPWQELNFQFQGLVTTPNLSDGRNMRDQTWIRTQTPLNLQSGSSPAINYTYLVPTIKPLWLITNDHTSRWTSIWFDITFVSSYHGLQLVIFDILSFLPNSSFSQMMRPRSLMTFPTSVSSSTIRRVLSSGSPETINGRYYCESLTMWMHIDI